MNPIFVIKKHFFCFLILPFSMQLFNSCASRGALKAEEYFSIGMAYYELGQNNISDRERYFREAEKWLNRARAADKTMTASDYNLGRLAFETGRYGEAAVHFENILKRDPENLMALKAASYSRIKNGDLPKAEALYERVLALVPESADDGYNYALVLYGMREYEKSEAVLNKYPYALEENQASMLLYARSQKAQGKIEAIDSYAKWITAVNPASPQGLYEYALVLEDAGHYARALEQYGEAINALARDTDDLKKSTLMFEEARLFLVADPENREGITKLNAAVSEGFSDMEAINALIYNENISGGIKDEIRLIIGNMMDKSKEAAGTD